MSTQLKVKHLSPSRLKAARLCPARMMARVDGELDEEQGQMALIGTLAHEACKFWYRPSRFIQDPIIPNKFRGQNDYATADDAFKAAIASLGEKKKPDGKIVCELPQTPDGIDQAREMFNQIIAYYNRDVCRIMFAERQYEGTLAGGVPVNLIIDLGIDRDNGTLEIVDFKTGFITMSTEEMYEEDQVKMNTLAVRRDPDFAQYGMIGFTYFWARKGYETGPVIFTPEALSDYEQSLGHTFRALNTMVDPPEIMNRFCGGCGRRFECKRFRQWITEATGALTNVVDDDQYNRLAASGILRPEQLSLLRQRDLLTAEQIAQLTDEQVMATFDKLKGQEDVIGKMRKQLGTFLHEKMKSSNVTAIEAGKFKARRQQNKSESFNTKTVIQLAQAKSIDIDEVVEPRDKNVKALLGNDPESMSTLQRTLRRSMNQEFIVVTAKDKGRAKTGGGTPIPANAPLPTALPPAMPPQDGRAQRQINLPPV